jgi:hypothetical protein
MLWKNKTYKLKPRKFYVASNSHAYEKLYPTLRCTALLLLR